MARACLNDLDRQFEPAVDARTPKPDDITKMI
jgi:hypothetical protein